MCFKPLGVKVTPVVYAASSGKTSIIGAGSDARLGTHTTDGSYVEARVTHCGTSLDWHYAKSSPFDLEGGWKATHFGEWGLRFWVILCLSQDDGAPWRYDEKLRAAWRPAAPSDNRRSGSRSNAAISAASASGSGSQTTHAPRLANSREMFTPGETITGNPAASASTAATAKFSVADGSTHIVAAASAARLSRSPK